MIATSSVSIVNVNDGAPGATGPQGVSVVKVVSLYRLSDSSNELTGDETLPAYQWSEEKPEIPSGKYLWIRERTYLSNNSSVDGTPHCDVVISGLVFDVDRNSNAITTKIWESDISTAINDYNDETVSVIADRVTQTETNINGITTRVSSVESTTTSLGTRMTSAESSITQNANNINLMVSVDGTTSSLTLTQNMLAAMTSQFVVKDPNGSQTIISGGRIQANAITTAMLDTDAIKSSNYNSGTSGSNIPAYDATDNPYHYSTAGTFLDLSNGNFYSPNFSLINTVPTGSSASVGAYLNGTLIAGANSKIGPWNVTANSIYKVANTLGSTSSGAAYFGDLGLSVGDKFKVDASGVATLGVSSGYHATMDTDSFDVLNGSTVLATFGEDTVIGDIDGESYLRLRQDNIQFVGKTSEIGRHGKMTKFYIGKTPIVSYSDFPASSGIDRTGVLNGIPDLSDYVEQSIGYYYQITSIPSGKFVKKVRDQNGNEARFVEVLKDGVNYLYVWTSSDVEYVLGDIPSTRTVNNRTYYVVGEWDRYYPQRVYPDNDCGTYGSEILSTEKYIDYYYGVYTPSGSNKHYYKKISVSSNDTWVSAQNTSSGEYLNGKYYKLGIIPEEADPIYCTYGNGLMCDYTVQTINNERVVYVNTVNTASLQCRRIMSDEDNQRYFTCFSGDYDIATQQYMGGNSTSIANGDAIGENSVAILGKTYAKNSISLGNNRTYGEDSVALGSENVVWSNNGCAIGTGNKCEGGYYPYSYAIGSSNVSGQFACTFGNNLEASGIGSTAIGLLNIDDPYYIFMIGNGYFIDNGGGEVRSNALTVDRDGNMVVSGNVIAANTSHIGQIIMSTTLNTMAKVIAVYGGTTWIQHSGYMLRGATSATFNHAASDGGADTVTLTTDQIPAHTHGTSGAVTNGITGGGHTHAVKIHKDNTLNGKSARIGGASDTDTLSAIAANTGTHTHTLPNHTHTSVGGGKAHNNLPAYKNVYIWERTA